MRYMEIFYDVSHCWEVLFIQDFIFGSFPPTLFTIFHSLFFLYFSPAPAFFSSHQRAEPCLCVYLFQKHAPDVHRGTARSCVRVCVCTSSNKVQYIQIKHTDIFDGVASVAFPFESVQSACFFAGPCGWIQINYISEKTKHSFRH